MVRVETIKINNTKANKRNKSATTEQYFSELLKFGKAMYLVKLCKYHETNSITSLE